MAIKGADALGTPGAADLKAAGFEVFGGYLGRNLTRAFVQRLLTAGVKPLPIYEEDGTPGDADGAAEPADFQDGARQGGIASNLLASIPELAGYGCVFTDDVSKASYEEVREWAKGIRSTFHGVLVYYGPSHHGDRLVDEGHADSVWIEGAWSFSQPYVPGKAPQSRHACGLQYPNQTKVSGVTVDLNDFYSTPWLPGGKTTSAEKDWFDMATQADLKAVIMDDEVLAAIAGKVADALDGTGRVQGQSWAAVADLGEVLEEIRPEPNQGTDPNKPALRRLVEQIYNAVGAHP